MLSSVVKPPKPPSGKPPEPLPSTPWLWAYWPVRIVVRAGQHSGNGEKLFWNAVPDGPPISRRTRGMASRSDSAMSSVITSTMLGRGSLSGASSTRCAAGDCWALTGGPGANPSAAVPMSAAASSAMRPCM